MPLVFLWNSSKSARNAHAAKGRIMCIISEVDLRITARHSEFVNYIPQTLYLRRVYTSTHRK